MASEYAIVKLTFEPATECYYAETLEDARAIVAEQEAIGGEWRIYSA